MTDRTLAFIAIGLSVASLSYAGWVHFQGSEALATRALQRREAELVRQLAPRMDAIYRDMLADPSRRPKNPTTLPELLDPLIALMEHVGDPAGQTKPITKQ